MEINICIPNYMEDDTNLDQSDFESKTEMMCYLIPTTKFYMVWLLYQAYYNIDSLLSYVYSGLSLSYVQCDL